MKYIRIFFLLVITMGVPYIAFSQSGTMVTDNQRQAFVDSALVYLGTPYAWGGENTSGMDCSGLIYASAQDSLGIEVSRTVKTLYNSMELVPLSDAQVGDIVFFDTSWLSPVSHVGIYVGDNTFLHAPSSGSERFVKISSLDEPYWQKRCIGAGVFTSLRGTVDLQIHSEVYKMHEINSSDAIDSVLTIFTKVTSVLINAWHSVKAILNKEIVLPYGDILKVQSLTLYKLLIIGFVGLFVLRKIVRVLGFWGLLVILVVVVVLVDLFLFERQLIVEQVLGWEIQKFV